MHKIFSVCYLCLLVAGTTFFCLALAGCEGYMCGEGIIYDSQTNEPIDSVMSKVLTGDQVQYSDSVGHYNVCNRFGGCVPTCPDIIVEFSKTGYKTKKVTNPRDIRLEQVN